MRQIIASAAAAALLACALPAGAQEEGVTPDDAPAAEAEDGAQAPDDARAGPRGQGPRYGRGEGPGKGMRGGYGRHHGRHHGRGQAGPTLSIHTERPGLTIDFECNAPMPMCLEAIERVYAISGRQRGRGRDE